MWIARLWARAFGHEEGHISAPRLWDDTFEQEADPITSELLQATERRLMSMPVMTREVFLLFIVDRMSIAQIATRLALRKSKVRLMLRDAIVVISRDAWDGHA
jgi:DNA-directed RNA polymerase specialized sigma24 family protein